MSYRFRCATCGHDVGAGFDFTSQAPKQRTPCTMCGHLTWEQVEDKENKPLKVRITNAAHWYHNEYGFVYEVLHDGYSFYRIVDHPSKSGCRIRTTDCELVEDIPKDDGIWVRVTNEGRCLGTSWHILRTGEIFRVLPYTSDRYMVDDRDGQPARYIYKDDCEQIPFPGEVHGIREHAGCDPQTVNKTFWVRITGSLSGHNLPVGNVYEVEVNDPDTYRILPRKGVTAGVLFRQDCEKISTELALTRLLVDQLKSEKHQQANDLYEVRERFVQCEKDLANMTERCSADVSAHAAGAYKRNKQIYKLEQSLGDTAAALAQYTATVDRLKTVVADKDTEISALEERVREVLEINTDAVTQVSNLTCEVINLRGRNINIVNIKDKQLIEEQAEEIKGLKQHQNKLQDNLLRDLTERDMLRATLADKNHQLNLKESYIQTLLENKGVMETSFDARGVQIDELQYSVGDLLNERLALEQELKAEREKQEYRVAYADAYAKAHDELIEYVNDWEPGEND